MADETPPTNPHLSEKYVAQHRTEAAHIIEIAEKRENLKMAFDKLRQDTEQLRAEREQLEKDKLGLQQLKDQIEVEKIALENWKQARIEESVRHHEFLMQQLAKASESLDEVLAYANVQ